MFYETLKEVAMKKKYMSPSAVCDALGMSRSNITYWKNGRLPSMRHILMISDFLGVKPTRLIPKDWKH